MDGIEIEAYGHLFDSVLVAGHQPCAPTSTAARSTTACAFRLRVLRAIRERVGPDYIVGIRMAVDERLEDGIDAPVGLEILRRLDAARQLIDFVNVIRGNIVNDAVLTEVIPIHGMRSAPHLDFAGMVRAETGLAGAARLEDRRRRRPPVTRSAKGWSTWSA